MHLIDQLSFKNTVLYIFLLCTGNGKVEVIPQRYGFSLFMSPRTVGLMSLLFMIQDVFPIFQLPISSYGSVDVLLLVLYSVLLLHGGCSRSLNYRS